MIQGGGKRKRNEAGVEVTEAALSWRDVLSPRHELVTLSTMAYEICWSFGYFAVALQASSQGQHGVSVFTFASLVFVASYSTRFILNSTLSQSRKQAVSLALAVISILLAIRATFFAGYAPGDFSWLGQLPLAVANLFIAFSPVMLLIVMGIYAWWRGMSLAQASYDFDGVGFRFRLGVLMLALLALINTWVGRVDISGLLVACFFFGLVALALTRQEDVGRSESSVSLPLKGPWLAIMCGSVLLVLGLAALLALLLTPQAIRAFFDLFQPLEPLVIFVLYVVLIVVSFVVELVFNLIYLIVQNLINPNAKAQPFQLPQQQPLNLAQQPADLSALAAYWDPLRMICAVALFAGVLFMLALSLGQLQKRKQNQGDVTREGVPVTVDLNPFKRLRNLFRRPRFGLEDSDMASIRRIYANLTRLAAQRGFARRDAETPYEFMGELREAFPDSVPEEREITEAYVRVHYGERIPSADELAKVREAWKIIKGRGTAQST